MVHKPIAALLLERDEVYHHVGLIVAHRDGDVALVNNTQRDGCIRGSGTYFLDKGDAQNDEHPAVIVFITGTLVGVADVGKEIVGNLEAFLEFALVFFCRTSHLYPAVRLPLIELTQSIGRIPVSLHLVNPPRIFERSKKNVYGCEDWHFGKSSRLLVCSFRVIIVHVLVLLICPAKIHIFDESLYFPTLFFAIGMCFFHFFGIFHLTDRKCRQETTAFSASDNRHRQENPQETALIRNLDKDMVKTVTIFAPLHLSFTDSAFPHLTCYKNQESSPPPTRPKCPGLETLLKSPLSLLAQLSATAIASKESTTLGNTE